MSYYISNVRLKKNIKKTISRINKSIVTLLHTRKNINKAVNKLDHAVNRMKSVGESQNKLVLT